MGLLITMPVAAHKTLTLTSKTPAVLLCCSIGRAVSPGPIGTQTTIRIYNPALNFFYATGACHGMPRHLDRSYDLCCRYRQRPPSHYGWPTRSVRPQPGPTPDGDDAGRCWRLYRF